VEVYERLRELNAAPFAAYLQLGPYQVMSSSPERFLMCGATGLRPGRSRVPAARRNSREDAGTRPSSWQRKGPRELNMIVDLERNDLGRACATGPSASPPRPMRDLRRVHHLVSTVEGTLRQDCDWLTFSSPPSRRIHYRRPKSAPWKSLTSSNPRP